MRYRAIVTRRHGYRLRPAIVALVAVLGVGLGIAACSSGGSDPGRTAPASASADFTVFESDYGVRLAYPPGFVVRGTETRSRGFTTTITGPELSPMSEPKIIINEGPSTPIGIEFEVDTNITLFKTRGGEVVSRREVDVPGAAGTSIELEIVASEAFSNGEVLPIRTIELFFATQNGVSASVGVLAMERDFDAAQLREVIPTVEALP